MKYNNILKGTFLHRPNRFIAYVNLNGNEVVAHVKNTGRCKELLIEGSTVLLEKSDNPARKTGYDLISVYKTGLGLVNMDSQAPNKLVKEWLESGNSIFSNIKRIKPEFVYGESRIDFLVEYGEKKALIEVKGVTLEYNGISYFPDAPTKRGTKHLRELIKAIDEGYEAYIAFVIQMPGITKVCPNTKTDQEFALTYEKAICSGVKVLTLGCDIYEECIFIKNAYL